MRKRVIGIILCLVLICTLLPSAFAEVYTATFNPTEATSWDAKSDCSTLEVISSGDGTITVPANPEKTGYTFKGWSTVRDNKSFIVQIEAGKSLILENNETYYAIWEVINPTISFTLPDSVFTTKESYTIKATTTPETGGTVTWSSSDTSVMTVTKDASDSTGRTAIIKPTKSGNVQITACYTTDYGVTYCSQSATVTITEQTYKVIYNSNGCWYYDIPDSYQIKVSAPYTKTIKSISIYNKQSGTTYYPVIGIDVLKTSDANNYTTLTFTQAFMQTLPHYTYQTMTITFEDGTATTYLHILQSLSTKSLSLSTDSLKLLYNPKGSGDGKIVATVSPSNEKVTWLSSDSTVATANPTEDTLTCIIKPQKVGETIITAIIGSGTSAISKTCKVTVEGWSISLSPERLSIVLNSKGTGTGTLKATVTPSTSAEVIKWKSSDESVAAVKPSTDTYQTSCTVTGKKTGTATITAYINDTVQATCDVAVKAMSISFTELPKAFTSTDSYSITATVTAPATGSVTWKSSNTSVMTVTKDSTDSTGKTAILKPVSDGEAQITVSFTGTDGSTMSSSQITRVAIDKQTYKVVYNSNGCWYYDSPSSYQIKVSAPYTKTIKSISIYNKQSGTTYYPVIGTDVSKTYDVSDANKYTILTFTKAFMQTLPHYTYQTMTITFEDGTAATYVHVMSTTSSPITGDVQFNYYWILLALGAAGLGAAQMLRKKEEY